MPTQLIKRYLEEVARWMRNEPDYDDFGYGTEPIPGDKTWCKTCSKCSCRMSGKKEDQ